MDWFKPCLRRYSLITSGLLNLSAGCLLLAISHRLNGYDSPWTDSPHVHHAIRMQETILAELGRRIREKRKERSWTQEDLAANAHIDRSYIGGVERGERNLTFTVLCEICLALGCDVAELTSGLPEIKP